MGLPFLCFKEKAALFLIPLQAVSHVVPAPQEAEESAPQEELKPQAVPFARLWGEEDKEPGRYGVVLAEEGRQAVFLADEVLGVAELPEDGVKALPDEVRSSKNSFIRGMVYIEPLDGWGFVTEPAKIFELEGIGR